MLKQLLVISALLMIGARVLAQQEQIEEENPTSKLLLLRRYNVKESHVIIQSLYLCINEYTRWSKKLC